MHASTESKLIRLASLATVCSLLVPGPAAVAGGKTAQGTIAVLNTTGCLDQQHIKELESVGKLAVYDDTDTEQEVRDRLRGVRIAIAQPFVSPVNAAALGAAKSLELLVVCTTGFDQVDLATTKRNGTVVANTAGYSTEGVAEHAIALMLAVSKNIPAADAAMRKQPFEVIDGVPALAPYRGFELSGKTLGIIGLGKIGGRVAEIAHAFGMTVLVYDRSPKAVAGTTAATLEDLLKQSDVVSLHLPLTPETEKFLGAPQLALMKPTAILINTARGKLVDEAALHRALQSGQIAGAGLDTIDDETPDNPLLKLPNVVLSPHSAYFTRESMTRRADVIVATVKAFLAGAPINVVSQPP